MVQKVTYFADARFVNFRFYLKSLGVDRRYSRGPAVEKPVQPQRCVESRIEFNATFPGRNLRVVSGSLVITISSTRASLRTRSIYASRVWSRKKSRASLRSAARVLSPSADIIEMTPHVDSESGVFSTNKVRQIRSACRDLVNCQNSSGVTVDDRNNSAIR